MSGKRRGFPVFSAAIALRTIEQVLPYRDTLRGISRLIPRETFLFRGFYTIGRLGMKLAAPERPVFPGTGSAK